MNNKKQNIQHSHGIRIEADSLGKLIAMQRSPECRARPVIDRRNVDSTT